MCLELERRPQFLGLLEMAKERLHEDAPRLVLADYLEEHGCAERAEFVRLQCRLASEALTPSDHRALSNRRRHLLRHHGGFWLGSLWQWHPADFAWHRGLLSLRVPTRYDPELVRPLLPWVDALTFDITSKACLRQAIALLAGANVNHLHLELRQVLRESFLRETLAALPESRSLRSLGFTWPLGMLRPGVGGNIPAISTGFLSSLLGESSVGRHLSHLASSFPFGEAQVQVLREHGVEPVHARQWTWTHEVSPTFFGP
jgi:uncharacterized protein (TIGR02996 family)